MEEKREKDEHDIANDGHIKKVIQLQRNTKYLDGDAGVSVKCTNTCGNY